MRGVRAHFRLRGLGAERLLERLRAQGIILYDIRRLDARTLEVGCEGTQAGTLAEMCAARGFRVERLARRGWAKRLDTAARAGGLTACAVIFLLLLALSLRFVWRVEIAGAGMYAGEVRAFLREKGITPGTPKRDINVSALCGELSLRLPRVAWVRAEKSGVTLRVRLTLGVPAPQVETAGGAGDIIALRDGVIDSLRVYAGTAAVATGDFVRAGDVLIRGEERVSQEETTRVRARGQALARVWETAAARASAAVINSVETGKTLRRRVIASPVYRFCFAPAPDYLTQDTDAQCVPIGGAWVPLWLEKTTHIEIAVEAGEPDHDGARAQAGALALQRLLAQCGGADDFIDKWLDYSMIEGEIIEARATAERLMDIAAFAPETMN